MPPELARTAKRSGPRPAGHVCHVCEQAIPLADMLIITLSGMWSVREPELPQLTRTLKLHRDPCAHVYMQGWREDALQD